MRAIVVVGSLNMDLMIEIPRLPAVGETLQGGNARYLLGGKGANQAVAAARLGAPTSLVGCVGEDAFGTQILTTLATEKSLSTDHVRIVADVATGVANVCKLPTDNSIIVVPGANTCVDEALISESLATTQAPIILTQLEIPLDAVVFAFQEGRKQRSINILNPAPYQQLPEGIWSLVDYVTPNETEFSALVGRELATSEALEAAMLEWSAAHDTQLIVTRGGEGCSYVENGVVHTVPSYPVAVCDTTGAGDTFNGGLAVGLAEGLSLVDSLRLGNQAASLAVQAVGAQSGMPTRAELLNTYPHV